MKVYGDLIVSGNQPALEKFIDVLEQKLTNGWIRYHAREAEVSKAALGRLYCFACKSEGARPASELWIATRSDGSLYVSNILPQEFSSLTYDQYNAVLFDFYKSCAEPAANIVGVIIELKNSDPHLEDFLPASTARLLRNFSKFANRSFLNANDRKRWNEFLISAYREGATLDASMLRRWLIEEEKWPEDEASNLTIEYEHARDLLEIYESQQV